MNYAQIEDTQSTGNGLSVREKIQYSLVGIVMLGGTIILVRNLIKKSISRNEQRLSVEEGSAPAFAKKIKMSFDNDGWWGTDKEALRTAIRGIPNKAAFKEVINSYQRLYSRSLMADMQSELKTTEYSEMLAIINSKPDNSHSAPVATIVPYQSWAKRLKAAFDITYGPFPGTDEAAIRAVFLEIPSQAAFQQLAQVYKSIYGSDLINDLKSELEFWEYQPMMQLISEKPRI